MSPKQKLKTYFLIVVVGKFFRIRESIGLPFFLYIPYHFFNFFISLKEVCNTSFTETLSRIYANLIFHRYLAYMEKSVNQQTVKEILALFEQYGEEEYGENLSQQEHMIQAAQMAQLENQANEVVIAALLHDIGHLYGHQLNNDRMGDFGIMDHEALGADYLTTRGFSDKVATLVKGHVLAKRYLCYADPDYMVALSHASRETLKQQGGPMMKAEAELFRNSPYFDLSIRMRHWDEEAKIPNQILPSIDSFRDLLLQHLA